MRFVKTGWHLIKSQSGQCIISHQAFKAMGPGVSVELHRLYAERSTDSETRNAANDAVGAKAISAAAVRSTSREYDNKGSGKAEKLGICYTPDQADGHNPFHCDIFRPPSTAAAKKLLEASHEEIEINQVEALRRYEAVRKKA